MTHVIEGRPRPLGGARGAPAGQRQLAAEDLALEASVEQLRERAGGASAEEALLLRLGPYPGRRRLGRREGGGQRIWTGTRPHTHAHAHTHGYATVHTCLNRNTPHHHHTHTHTHVYAHACAHTHTHLENSRADALSGGALAHQICEDVVLLGVGEQLGPQRGELARGR